MLKINFIDNPSFEVDFGQFAAPKSHREEDLKAKRVALAIFQLLSVLPICAAKATWRTLSFSLISFKHIVLGFYGSWDRIRPPGDIYLITFKVAFWALGLVWCVITTSIRLVLEELSPTDQKYLTGYGMEGINYNHLRSIKSEIDVSHIDQKVKIDDLIAIYDAINFDREDEPGYMASSSRLEGSITYSIEDLKKGLKIFIDRVNNREAFVGTPPSYDTPRLMAFYQQIENAIRFSIDCSNRQIIEFQEIHGADSSQYNEESMKAYKGILEDRSRIAIDLAIAGKHCGARYLGESMSVYENICGDGITHEGLLEDSIIEILARKRYKIAAGQIQKYLGNDTHQYNLYMQNLGKVLGLPGTENIIEHLANTFDQDRYLKLFFDEYTMDLIIETIQSEFKRSQLFREKVLDWFKDQSGDWKKDEYQKDVPQLTLRVLREINHTPDAKEDEMSLVSDFIDYFQNQEIELPSLDEGWPTFINALFSLPQVLEWRDKKFPPSLVEQTVEQQRGASTPNLKMQILLFRRQKMERLKTLCNAITPTLDEFNRLKGGGRGKLLADLRERSQKSYLIEKICTIIPLERETLSRIIATPESERKQLLEEAIAARRDRERRSEFFEQITKKHVIESFNSEEKAEFTLSPALMEWLTVSQGIFNVQDVREE